MLWEAARRHEGVGRSHPAAREPLGRAQVASRAKTRIRLFSPTLKRYLTALFRILLESVEISFRAIQRILHALTCFLVFIS